MANAVKPLENIDGIKILQGYGAATGKADGASMSTSGSGGMAEQVTNAALQYRANAPIVDAMLREVGLVDSKEGTLQDLLNGDSPIIASASSAQPQPADLSDVEIHPEIPGAAEPEEIQ